MLHSSLQKAGRRAAGEGGSEFGFHFIFPFAHPAVSRLRFRVWDSEMTEILSLFARGSQISGENGLVKNKTIGHGSRCFIRDGHGGGGTQGTEQLPLTDPEVIPVIWGPSVFIFKMEHELHRVVGSEEADGLSPWWSC